MTAFIAILPEFIASLPALFTLMVKLMQISVSFVSWAKDREFKEWLDQLDSQILSMKGPSTDDQKKEAIQNLSRLMRILG